MDTKEKKGSVAVKRDKDALAIKNLFSTPEGKEVLEILKNETIHKNVMLNGSCTCGILYAQLIARQEGKNELVRFLISIVSSNSHE